MELDLLRSFRRHDADVPLDQQAAFDRVYNDGPFDDLDYARPAVPPPR